MFYFIQSGFIFALPYIAQFLVTIIVGQTVDRIRTRKILSITTLRKLQAIIGKIKILITKKQTIFLYFRYCWHMCIFSSYWLYGMWSYWSSYLLYSCCWFSWFTNMWTDYFASWCCFELCWYEKIYLIKYRNIILWLGTLVGITNALATIPGFVGPYVVGAITNNNVRFLCFVCNEYWLSVYF